MTATKEVEEKHSSILRRVIQWVWVLLNLVVSEFLAPNRAVGSSENPGVPVLYRGHNLSPLVEIGLTDLPKSGGAMAPPAPPGTTGLT